MDSFLSSVSNSISEAMNKLSISLIIILLSCLSTMTEARNARRPVFTYGAEWNYVGTFASAKRQNFYSPDGYRVGIRKTELTYASNGEILFHVGVNPDDNWNVALYAGYTNIAKENDAIPISLRLTRFFYSNELSDKWLCYLDFGSGFTPNKELKPQFSGKIGGGYRFSLSRRTKIDLVSGIKLSYTKPQVYFDNELIPDSQIKRNSAIFTALTIGISITL